MFRLAARGSNGEPLHIWAKSADDFIEGFFADAGQSDVVEGLTASEAFAIMEAHMTGFHYGLEDERVSQRRIAHFRLIHPNGHVEIHQVTTDNEQGEIMKTTPAMDKLIGEAVLMRGRGTAPIHRGRWGVDGNAATLKGLVARGLAEIIEDWHVLTESGETRRVSMLPVVEVIPATTSTAETLAALTLVMDAQDILATNEMPGDAERSAQADEDAATYAEILAEQDRDEPMPGGEAAPWRSSKGKHGRHARNR